jgi:hypothetical protein
VGEIHTFLSSSRVCWRSTINAFNAAASGADATADLKVHPAADVTHWQPASLRLCSGTVTRTIMINDHWHSGWHVTVTVIMMIIMAALSYELVMRIYFRGCCYWRHTDSGSSNLNSESNVFVKVSSHAKLELEIDCQLERPRHRRRCRFPANMTA